MNIWHELTKPIFILAPMEDVTDTVFRRIVLKCGRPDLFFTEFTSADGMVSKGKDKVLRRLVYTPEEKPIIAQIWGNTPAHYSEAARMVKEMGYDGVDINMGCPDKKIISKGFCSGLIRTPKLAVEIIKATKDAVGDFPVSVKTRIGYDKVQTEDWIGTILETNVVAISIHARTRDEMSKVPARWEEVGKAVKLRDSMKKETLIIGNGDVTSYAQGMDLVKQYGVDGIMIGRGIFQNLWIFNPDVDYATISLEKRIKILIEHLELFHKTWPDAHFDRMKKFYKIYFSGIENAAHIRNELMQFKTAEDTINYLNVNKQLWKS